MLTYTLTKKAQSDLIEIHQFTVQKWGPVKAKKYLVELRKTIQLLFEKPALGKLRPEIGTNVLSFPYVSHVIYYVSYERKCVVFGVLHKRMVPLNHLGHRSSIF